MVAIAQLVEPRIVIPVVGGSSPLSHPIIQGRIVLLTSLPCFYSTVTRVSHFNVVDHVVAGLD